MHYASVLQEIQVQQAGSSVAKHDILEIHQACYPVCEPRFTFLARLVKSFCSHLYGLLFIAQQCPAQRCQSVTQHGQEDALASMVCLSD